MAEAQLEFERRQLYLKSYFEFKVQNAVMGGDRSFINGLEKELNIVQEEIEESSSTPPQMSGVKVEGDLSKLKNWTSLLRFKGT